MKISNSNELIKDYYSKYKEDLIALSIIDNGNCDYSELFLEDRCEFLVNQEVLQEYHIVNFASKEFKIQVDAWGFQLDNEADKISLVLVLSSYVESEIISKQTLSEFRTFLMKGKRFFNSVIKNTFNKFGEYDNQNIIPLVEYIQGNATKIDDLLILGITNSIISSSKDSLIISENTIQSIPCHYDVWDLKRFEKIESSLRGRESVDINFVEDYNIKSGIPMLTATANCNDIASYLFVLPGKILADMYEKWNERLLEQNPRTFLQFTRKVNKKIRNTITNEPEKFFSYNNGISGVASGIVMNDKGTAINCINDFQIVNGGQTTASIYNTFQRFKKTKLNFDINLISVMVKLSVISDPDKALEIIPKISEYSNTQNTVSASAFSAHHPFHKKLETYSRNIWTPLISGGNETRWYYERVQGQYKNSILLYQTTSQKKYFQNQHPKNQVIKKVDLSKYQLCFEDLPHKVCLGAQKCYAEFCKIYLQDKDGVAVVDSSINEDFFKEICSKAILFKSLEKKLGRGFRFVTTPYTLSLVSYKLLKHGLSFDFKKIWNNQWDNEILINGLINISELILEKINNTKPESISILSEWGKKEDCWKKVKEIDFDITPFKEFAISVDKRKDQLIESKQIGKIDMSIDIELYVFQKGSEYWNDMYSWGESTKMLGNKDLQIINTARDFSKRIPSVKQCKALLKIEKMAQREGFYGAE